MPLKIAKNRHFPANRLNLPFVGLKSPYWFECADMDNDGNIDIVVGCSSGNQVSIFWNNVSLKAKLCFIYCK